MGKSINELVVEYFKKHPKQELNHGPVVDWVTEQWLKSHPHPPRDPWRAVRQLHQKGFLIKIKKGIYKYDPDHIRELELFDFPPEVREAIFKREVNEDIMVKLTIAGWVILGSLMLVGVYNDLYRLLGG